MQLTSDFSVNYIARYVSNTNMHASVIVCSVCVQTAVMDQRVYDRLFLMSRKQPCYIATATAFGRRKNLTRENIANRSNYYNLLLSLRFPSDKICCSRSNLSLPSSLAFDQPQTEKAERDQLTVLDDLARHIIASGQQQEYVVAKRNRWLGYTQKSVCCLRMASECIYLQLQL